MAMASRRHRTQVEAERRVRFGPEQSALYELLLQAIGDRDATIKSAEGSARGIRAAARAGRPVTQETFNRARAAHEGAGQTLHELLRIDPANPLGGAIHRERAGAARRLSDTEAGALQELTKREQAAEAGRAFATTQAHAKYAGDAAQIRRRLLDVSQEGGAFAQGRLAELVEAAEDRALEERKISESERHNRASEDISRDKAERGSKPKSYKRPEGQVTKQREIVTGVNDALSLVRFYRDRGASFSQARRALSAPKSQDNPYGGLPRHIVNAAINLEQEGHLGPVNERALRGAGLYAVPRRWRRKRERGTAPFPNRPPNLR